MDYLIWGSLFIVLVIVELSTVNFVSIWFAVGALASLICALFGMHDIAKQSVVFVIVATLFLIATKPLVKALKANRYVPTNADLDIGKTALVIERINNSASTGRVRLNGVDWTARSVDGSLISAGTNVVVAKVDGSKLIVKK